MGFLDDALGSSVPGGNLAKPLIIGLGALLASGALFKHATSSAPSSPSLPTPSASPPEQSSGGVLGGLGGLLSQFQQNGHGDVAKSWVGPGQNQSITPAQLGAALGPAIVAALAQRTGLSQQELMSHLSEILPGVVDKLTPNGRLPTESEQANWR